MSIKIEVELKQIDEQEFYEIDYVVTGLAYAIHNEIGKLWDEKIYQNELADRCRAAGFEYVKTEVPIILLYKDFCKEYYVDLLVNNSIIYELKTVSRLKAEHNKQALNYLLLLGLQHGKLINFRPASVQKRFVSTTLLTKDRYELTFDDQQWFAFDEDCTLL